MSKLRLLDLFSGIGGFSLGLERSGGFETVAFCEIEPYPRAVLARHWPGVPCYHDIRELTADALARDGIAVDAICGGFPCQDISHAGLGAGIEGSRSGLWGEYARLIGELRPRFVIVENVSALLGRGMGRVLGDLAAFGYDATWDCIPASAVGAPHRRDRVWIVAHSTRVFSGRPKPRAKRQRVGGRREPIIVAGADQFARHQGGQSYSAEVTRRRDADRSGVAEDVPNANVAGLALREGQPGDAREECETAVGADWWLSEPDVGRVADGVPARVDRLQSLGNAVVPQIPEIIGRAIMQAVGMTS
jgi:DNA (cytosine-5)-methyltransferase 1